MNPIRWIGLFLLCLAATTTGAQTLYTDLSALQQDLGQNLCTFALDAEGVLNSTQIDGVIREPTLTYDGPRPNSNVGAVLNFDQAPPFFTLHTLQPGASFTFDDDEGAGNLTSFDSALSVGDIDNFEDDDFRITVPADQPMTAIGLLINDSNGVAGEQLRLLDAAGSVINTLDLPALPNGAIFVGVISPQPFFGVEYDEDISGDDIALAAVYFQSCTGPDSYEQDDQPQLGPFLDGFDFITDDDIVVERIRTLHTPTDVDWTLFATTYNYPVSWSGAEPNTKLYVQLCQGACDGVAAAALNLKIFNFDLIEDAQTAMPVFELNACPGNANDEIERELPNFVNDETLFVQITACDGSTDVNYRLLLRRGAIGIDLHKITGTVSLFDQSGQLGPAPAFAVITSNYNDFTFANPADGTFQIATLARSFQSGQEITDLELTVRLFRAPFEASQTKPVTNMVAAESQVINFVLNLFADGFEDRP